MIKENGIGEKVIMTGLDLSTVEGKMQALKAMSSPTVPNEELRVNTFKMVNVFIHTILLTDEKTGEQQECRRTVLFDDQGRTTAFVSDGIITGIENIVTLFGPPPWDPAIPVRTKQSKTRRGYNVLNLEIVAEEYGK